MAKLVIVESPSKAKTIKKYLGGDYEVIASQGHIIDLPSSKFAVDVDNDFKPEYKTMKGKANIIKEIKSVYSDESLSKRKQDKKARKLFVKLDSMITETANAAAKRTYDTIVELYYKIISENLK